MRSSKIHAAIAHGNTRFEICRIVAKGVRLTYQQDARLEDSINRVLGMLNPDLPVPALPLLGLKPSHAQSSTSL